VTLNRQELEDYIIDLYHNQKRTYREIQKITRKSFRDSKAMLDKANPDHSSTSLSVPSRAYQMFEEGKNPLQVACTKPQRERSKRVIQRVLESERGCINSIKFTMNYAMTYGQ
jgi:hypothetical protein